MKSVLLFFALIVSVFALTSCLTLQYDLDSTAHSDKLYRYDEYAPGRANIDVDFDGAGFEVVIDKQDANTPVGNGLYITYIKNAVQWEIEENGGTLAESTMADFLMDLSVSKYTLIELSRKSYKILIDAEVTVSGVVAGDEVFKKIYSLSGRGETPQVANQDALKKLAEGILNKPELADYMDSMKRSSAGDYGAYYDRLAGTMMSDLQDRVDSDPPMPYRVAFAGFTDDYADPHSGSFLSSLINTWPAQQWTFYSRDQMGRILEEQNLQLSGLFDSASMVDFGRLSGVDFLIAGRLNESGGDVILEAQVLSVTTGEILSSRNVAIPQ